MQSVLNWFRSTDALIEQGRRLSASGRHDAALAALQAAIERTARSRAVAGEEQAAVLGAAHLERGRVLRAMGRNEAAGNELLQAWTLRTFDGEDRAYLVDALLKRGAIDTDAQRLYLSYFNDADPTTLSSGDLIARLRQLSTPDWNNRTTWDAARAWNERLAEALPRESWPRRHVIRIDLARREFARAGRMLTAAAADFPADSDFLRWLAIALAGCNRWREVRSALYPLITDGAADAPLLWLNGLACRALGDAEGAFRSMSAAVKSIKLRPADALTYAEVRFECGQIDKAKSLLERLDLRQDLRWQLAMAAVAAAQADFDAAIRQFAELLAAPAVADQSASWIRWIAQQAPDAVGLRQALDKLPANARDEQYWTLCVNACIAERDWEAALAAASHLTPSPTIAEVQAGIVQCRLTELAGARQDAAALEFVSRLPAGFKLFSDSLAILGRAAARVARRAISDGKPAGNAQQALLKIAGISADMKAAIAHPLGLWLAHARCDATAHDLLAPLARQSTAHAEVRVHAAAAALRAGELNGCAAALERIGADDVRRLPLAAALAVRQGDFPAAWLHARMPEVRERWPLVSLAIQLGTRPREVDPQLIATLDDGAANYYRAVIAARRGDIQSARQLLSVLEPPPSVASVATRLRAWLAIRELAGGASGGDARRQLCLDIARHWPDDNGPLASLPLARGEFVGLWLETGNRRRGLALLEEWAREAGPADPQTCHNLAVWHIAEGARHAAECETGAAIAAWRRAIAYLAVPLGKFTYLHQWCRERETTYATEVVAEAALKIEQRCVAYLETTFHRYGDAWRNSSLSGPADQLGNLALVLRAELQAVRTLSDAGGFPSPDDPARTIAVGPGYLAAQGLDRPFAEFLEGLSVRAPLSDAMQQLLRVAGIQPGDAPWLLENQDGIDQELKHTLESLFSPLRCAWVLAGEGQIPEALKQAETPSPAAPENPAFCRPADAPRYQRFRDQTLQSLWLRAGEQEAAASQTDLPRVIECWRRALAIAESLGESDETAREVGRLTSGRSDVLSRDSRYGEAIALLEAVVPICPSSELKSQLALQYTNRGIEAANANDFAKAIDDLRRAHRLDSEKNHITSHLAMFLHLHAQTLVEGAPHEALNQMREAARLVKSCLERDPYNEQFRQIAERIRVELAMASIAAGEGDPDQMLEVLAAGNADNTVRLSTMYHNRGLEKAQQQDFAGAITDLERALELEPTSDVTRTMLSQCLAAHAQALAGQARLAEAIPLADRAALLDPENTQIQLLAGFLHTLSPTRR